MHITKENGKILLMRPFMPSREEFEPYLNRIWESRLLTNDGPIHSEFEAALCLYLGVKYISLFANGTLALLIALKALDLKGEVITSPFTSVSTLQAIHWNNLKPVFVDIDPGDLNIPAERIEAAITPETSAILPVHIFGNPCDVKGIREVAERHHLKTVYDAAHCFGVKSEGIPVCNFGDLAVLSFHATKVFNSIEGGAIVCRDRETKEHIDGLKSLKHANGPVNLCYGLNAKMNEFEAAFGLVQLQHIDEIIQLRKEATLIYLDRLSGIRGIEPVSVKQSTTSNYTYLPVLVNTGEFGSDRDELACHLERKGITTRKYFYPLASDFSEFSIYKTFDLPIAEESAQQVLCLPLYHDISREEIIFITDSIQQLSLNRSTGE